VRQRQEACKVLRAIASAAAAAAGTGACWGPRSASEVPWGDFFFFFFWVTYTVAAAAAEGLAQLRPPVALVKSYDSETFERCGRRSDSRWPASGKAGRCACAARRMPQAYGGSRERECSSECRAKTS